MGPAAGGLGRCARNSRGRTRTCDPLINSQLLYQLSYSGKRRETGGKLASPPLPLKTVASRRPPASQRLVELDRGHELLPFRLRQRQFRREQVALRVQDLQVARDAVLVTSVREPVRAP